MYKDQRVILDGLIKDFYFHVAIHFWFIYTNPEVRAKFLEGLGFKIWQNLSHNFEL